MSRYRETMAEALRKVYEDGHEDVSSSKRMCQTIVEDATQIRTKLDSMSAEDKLDTWWTNKLAKSADNLNSARDYIMNPIEESFEFTLDEGRMKTIYTMQQDGKSAKEIAKYMKLPVKTIKDILGESDAYDNERYEIRNGKAYRDAGSTPDKKNHVYAPDKKTAEKIFKQGKKVFREETDLEEKIKPFMISYSKGGTHAGFEDANTLPELQAKAQKLRAKGSTIDKMGRYNPPVGMKKEDRELREFSDAMLDRLAREFAPLKGKSISVQQANKLRAIFNNIPDRALDALRRKKIPFLSGLALSRMVQKGMPVKEEIDESYTAAMVFKAKDIARKMSGNYTNAVKEIEKIYKGLQYHPDVKKALMKANEQVEQIEKEQPEKEKKESDNKDSVIAALKDQISMLKQKLENEKNKAIKPEPNPDTGEVPLTIGLANKLLKDKEMKKEDVQEADLSKPQIKKVHKMADELPKKDFKDRYGKEKGDAVRYATATNIVKKKLGIEESAAAREIDRTNTRRDSMDYQMYKKSAELLRKKDYKALGKHIYDAETAPREYVMGVIDKKEPQAFKKMFGNQSGYYSLMKPLKMSENKEADMMFKKLSQRAQTYVNELLRTGMGTMDAIKKAKEKFNEGNMKNEEMRLRVEAIAGLKKKAEKSGMPYSILKKVYDRGMAAWKGGHRPGASQHQWAFARVNSFVTKSSGTWGGADKDLAKQVRGSK